MSEEMGSHDGFLVYSTLSSKGNLKLVREESDYIVFKTLLEIRKKKRGMN